jgi:hypothetical protein
MIILVAMAVAIRNEVSLWGMYFVLLYENRTMKLVEIVLRLGGGVEIIKIHFKYVCKCHNVPLYIICQQKEMNFLKCHRGNYFPWLESPKILKVDWVGS